MVPPKPDPPAPAARPRTAELLAPHLLREDVRLTASDRPGTFQLVAADPTGGVIRCLRAEPPRRGEVVSFSPLGMDIGPVRLLGRTAGRVRLPGGPPGPLFATEWVAITALDSASYLSNILRLVGVRIHTVDLPDTLAPGEELVYEPAAQQVRLISVSDGRDRQPTRDFDRGLGPAVTAGGPPGVLVETYRRRDSSWRRRLSLASSARMPVASSRAATAPGVGPEPRSLDDEALQSGRGPRARRAPTAPAWIPQDPAERRRAVTEPPVQVRVPSQEASRPHAPGPESPTARPSSPREPRWFERPGDGAPAAPAANRAGPTPTRSEGSPSLHPMFRRREFTGEYRCTPRPPGAPRRRTPPPSPPASPRSHAAAPPRAGTPLPNARHRTPASTAYSPVAAGAVPAWSSRTPEFPCDPREGEVEAGGSARPMTCVSVGQGSLVFATRGRVVWPEGAPVRVRVPVAPAGDGVVELDGRVQVASLDHLTGATVVRVVLVPRSVPPVFRRLVQFWARKGR